MKQVPNTTDSIVGWHAHVYFDMSSVQQAEDLCNQAAMRFPTLKKGRVHQKPIGPHSQWSCQLAFREHLFNKVISWLTLNRGELSVFIHPITGHDLIDHRDRAIWMGNIYPLDLSSLPETSVEYDL